MEDLQLTESQAKIAIDPHRFRVLCCGRRWGKTTLAIDQMKACAASKRNRRIVYVAPTNQQARDIAWEQLREECRDASEYINEARLEIRLVNGSTFFLKGWEAIETLRGQKFDLIVLDEVAMMKNFWSKWQEIIRPTLTDSKGEGIFISTPKGFNHFYDLFNLEGTDSDFKSFHFNTFDNPHIPKDEIEKAQKELTEDRFAQEYLADFRKTEGLVYKEFSRERHIFDTYPTDTVKKFGGVDPGFTNPAAVIEILKDRDRRYFVGPEWYKQGKTDAQIADYVSALKWNECYPDPENAGIAEELKSRGVNVREVIKGKDSVQNGISVVRELLLANRLFIHRSCVNLISEFETYSYPEKRFGHNEQENPVKEHDHALDALRYALMMESRSSNGEVDDKIQAQFSRNIARENLRSTR